MAKRKTRVKKQTSDSKYLGATVTTAERSAPKWRPVEAMQLVKRCQQFVMYCQMFNAQNAAQHKVRLYRKKGSAGTKAWAGRPVKGMRKNEYLRNPSKGYGPGCKAASFAEDAGEIEEIPSHPVLELFNNPNPWQNGTQFKMASYMQWQMFGVGYDHVVQESAGPPSELWIMGAQWVRPIPDKDDLIKGWMYGRDRVVEREFSVDEVVPRIWMPDPFNPYSGICPLHAVFSEADIYSGYQDSELSTLKNGSRPDFAVSVPATATDPMMDQIRAEVEKRHRGPTRRGDFFVMRDCEIVPLGFSPKEMENQAGRQDVRSVIAAAYGIPEALYRMNDSNRAGSLSALEQYGRFTMAPMLALDSELNTEFLARYGIDPGTYWFAADDPVPENRDAVRQDVTAFVTARVWTRNEARAELGLDPVPGGDEFDPGPAELAAMKPNANGDKPKGKPKKKPKAEKHVHEVDAKAMMSDVSAGGSNPPETLVQKLYRQVSEWLAMVAGDVEIPATVAAFTGEQLNPFVPQLIEAVSGPILAMLTDAGSVGAREIGKPSPADLEPFTRDAAAYMRTNNLRLTGSVTQTQTDLIKEAMAQGIEQGQSQAEMAAGVRAVLVGDRIPRATLIARTEAQQAHQIGKQMGWKAGGYWGSKIVLAPGACPTCVEFVKQYGDTRKLGEPFAKVGDEIDIPGKEPIVLTYQDIYAAGQLHPNDRCFCIPVEKAP